MPRITAFCFSVAVFISRMGMKISWSKTSISFCIHNSIDVYSTLQKHIPTLSMVLIPDKTLQKISTLISNTCGTGLTALRLKQRHKYWLMACTNVVVSLVLSEWINDDGAVIRGMCEFRMVRTRCRESSLDRIGCDLRSQSRSLMCV